MEEKLPHKHSSGVVHVHDDAHPGHTHEHSHEHTHFDGTVHEHKHTHDGSDPDHGHEHDDGRDVET